MGELAHLQGEPGFTEEWTGLSGNAAETAESRLRANETCGPRTLQIAHLSAARAFQRENVPAW